MKVFVYHEIFSNKRPVFIEFADDKTLIFISNLGSSKEAKERIEIEIPVVLDPSSNLNFWMDVSKLTIQDKKYIFEEGINSTDNSIYALIRTGNYAEPSEFYISAEDRDKITVLKQFNFYSDLSVSGKKFLDKMYFVKIDLPIDTDFYLYPTTEKGDYIYKSIRFFLSPLGYLYATDLENRIIREKEICKNYIALSKL